MYFREGIERVELFWKQFGILFAFWRNQVTTNTTNKAKYFFYKQYKIVYFRFQFIFQNVLPCKMYQTYMEQSKIKEASGNVGKKL